MEAWFCYCHYLEVEYGWNRIFQDSFLRFRIRVSRKRNCVRFGSRDKAAFITFWGFPWLVWWENDAEMGASRLPPLSCPGCSSSHLPAPQLAWRQELSTEPPSGSFPCSLSSSQLASVLQQIGQQFVCDPLASPLGRTISHIVSLIPTTNPLCHDTRFCFPDGALTIPLTHLPTSRNYVCFLSHFYSISYCSFIPHGS